MFLFRIAPGVSLNFKDILRLLIVFFIMTSPREQSASPSFKMMGFYLLIVVPMVMALSVLLMSANLAEYGVGDRLRNYADYLFIFGLLALIRDEQTFWFFMKALFGIAILTCILHLVEFSLGEVFTLSGEVSGLRLGHEGYGGFKRVFNRAPMITMVAFALALTRFVQGREKRFFTTLCLVLTVGSIALTFTRTLYIYAILFSVSILYQLKKRSHVPMTSHFSKMALGTLVIFVFLIAAGGSGVLKTIVYRFSSIDNAIMTNTDTMSARTYQMENTFDHLLSSPMTPIFGVGFSSQSTMLFTHDLGFTNILCNLGLFGAFFLFLWFRYIYSLSRSLHSQIQDPRYSDLVLVVVALFLPLLVTAYSIDFFTSSGFMMTVIVFTILEVVRRFKNQGVIQ